MKIGDQLQDLESFFSTLKETEGFDVFIERHDPDSDADIAKLEQTLGYSVHPEIAAMWRRGAVSVSGEMKHDSFVAIGRDFCSTSIVMRDLETLRDIAKQSQSQDPPEAGSPNAEFVRLAREGFPLSFENPVLASDATGAIYFLNFKDCDARKVGSTLSEHLSAWVASGAFSQLDEEGGQEALLAKVQPHLPAWAKDVKANAWLDTYRAVYFS